MFLITQVTLLAEWEDTPPVALIMLTVVSYTKPSGKSSITVNSLV